MPARKSMAKAFLKDAPNWKEFVGIVFLCIMCVNSLINKLIFSEWNVDYFQIADVGDIVMSSIYSIYAVFVLIIYIIPLSFFTYLSVSHSRRIGVIFSFNFRRSIFRKYIFLFFNVIYALSINAFVVFYVFTAYWTLNAAEFGDVLRVKDLGDSGISWKTAQIIVTIAFISAITIFHSRDPINYPRIVRPLAPITSFLFGIFAVIIIWLSCFLNPSQARWIGYVSNGYTEYKGLTVPDCSHLRTLWIGQRNTILECVRDKVYLKQTIYILNQQTNGLIGPIESKVAPPPPYSSRSTLPPPPIDRVPPNLRHLYYQD